MMLAHIFFDEEAWARVATMLEVGEICGCVMKFLGSFMQY